MITRIGHIALHVADLDAAVDFQQQVIGMVETERVTGASYLTCNERHHELILIEDRAQPRLRRTSRSRSPTRARSSGAAQRLTAAGGTLLGGVYDGEPGIDRALQVRAPGGHVYKLFCGMETDRRAAARRPARSSSSTSPARSPIDRGRGALPHRRPRLPLLRPHGPPRLLVALRRRPPRHRPRPCAPRTELSHYAYQWSDLNALGRVADRLKRRARPAS